MHLTELLRNRDLTAFGEHMAGEVMKELGAKSKQIYQYLLPAVDMFEDGNELVIIIDLPGFSKKDINLRITGGVLSISAKRDPEEHLGTTYYSQRPNQINKRVLLPIAVPEDEKIVGTAKFSDGVIILRIPIPKSSNISIV
jgi:HSP20 family molecular chaperone IbpA